MTVRSERPQGPGRGLAALSRSAPRPEQPTIELPLARIRANPRQPRLRMDDDALAGLAASLREHGVLMPRLVARRDGQGGYILIAGERRWQRRASWRASNACPCSCGGRPLADQDHLELALVENLQRADLGPSRPRTPIGGSSTSSA